MRLTTFETPIWSTIQGEGVLVGTPSVFVRLHGCDYSCSFCDTPGSWKPGSTWVEWTPQDIARIARSFHLSHAVITGGNPLLQREELPDLIVDLQTEWVEHPKTPMAGWRRGMHVTVETQASIYDDFVAAHADLMSLSPKLHAWNEEVLRQYLDSAARRNKRVQIKVVTQTEDEAKEAIKRIWDVYKWVHLSFSPERVDFILQPEFSGGRKNVELVHKVLDAWMQETMPGYMYPVIRILPQAHKRLLFVT